MSVCAALLAGCAPSPVESIAAAVTVPSEERTDLLRCREADPRLESLVGALETLELANAATFDTARTLATSALASWVSSFEDAPDAPLSDLHEAGERKLAALDLIDATTPHTELLEWIDATLEVTDEARATCDELTAPF